jgi:LacI family transcriptional regulator
MRLNVETSISKLGYRPHAAARGMRGQTFTLGVIFSDIQNPFFSEIIGGINSALAGTQYQPLIGVSQGIGANEISLIGAMTDRQMDGVILVAPHMSSEEIEATATSVPTVIVGHHASQGVSFDTVNDDDVAGAHLVVRNFARRGFRRICFFGLDPAQSNENHISRYRELGYGQCMAEMGLRKEIQIVRATSRIDDVQRLARGLLISALRPEAIFCWTDYIAFEVLGVVHELGLSDSVAVVGYDNTHYCDLKQISLTSVDQSGTIMGAHATRLLLERINGRQQAEHIVIDPVLVERASSGRQIGYPVARMTSRSSRPPR